ncbi:UNVERIFIED_CONTAM: DUF2313 domain-containing protein [Acinetobacter baumannii]|uniref:DUF2313 domain-containing protein n=1 Tax=Acinetobacter calcoaceticus/baumannii complex TaxID=909768 RepID=UPI000D642228|nr:DUF2313 domain-containing protein [Acinetobacter baumannii]MBD0530188.1 DUF2313 domain-containing protein [Acinetobacter baumannii]MDA3552849.1 DUF2313 domain-containing protein [Acinetobacter baumannii]MDO7460720.1 DUF2313 domain-containing protein [Acinetobacter baumannii]MDV4236442.1 DUF2313 domain-containing protein [Acinetobacter baumannii]NLP54420.1 DUF2313 domain-containing protein [Acinetobacter baumannii]
MTFEQIEELYSAVLRQLLPVGGYDNAQDTVIAIDIKAHAKVLAQADVDAKRILKTLERIPEELISEYEAALGLPLKCTVNTTKTIDERLQIIQWVQQTKNVLNRAYLEGLLGLFGIELIDLIHYRPMQCIAPCNSPVNTENLRFKVQMILKAPVQADMACLIQNYLPAYLRYDIKEQS